MALVKDRFLQELVDHFRGRRDSLRRQWVRQMTAKGLLKGFTAQEVEAESVALYDTCISCLETGSYEAALAYARTMAKQGVLGRMTTEHVIEGLLTLRDVFRRSLFKKYNADVDRLAKALDVYSPVANRILATVALAFVEEREKVIKKETSQLKTLVKAGMVLSAQLSLKAVLQRIVNMACKLVNAKYGALGILDEKGGLAQFITAGIDEKTKASIGQPPVGKGILGVLMREGKPLRLVDLTKDPRAHGFPPNHPPMRSFLGVPIVSKGKMFGNLYLTEKQGALEFSEEDEALAATLATQAAIAIENARLYEELQRSYQELKRSQDLLVRQEKLAALGRLAAGLAHELNNPLNSIAGFTEALQRRAQAGSLLASKEFADFPRFLQMIAKEVDRAATIVRRLLDFARQREPSSVVIEIGKVIEEAVSFVERQAAMANKGIVVEPLPGPIKVRADPQMLQQLLLNLLTNALDAIEGGGEVRIAVRCVSSGQGPVPSHPSWAASDFVEISVSDNGCGISPQDLPKIFDPFFTTKEVGKGTGLGLPICQSIVEQHGGIIEVKSEGVGRGTVVTVKLPVGEVS